MDIFGLEFDLINTYSSTLEFNLVEIETMSNEIIFKDYGLGSDTIYSNFTIRIKKDDPNLEVLAENCKDAEALPVVLSEKENILGSEIATGAYTLALLDFDIKRINFSFFEFSFSTAIKSTNFRNEDRLYFDDMPLPRAYDNGVSVRNNSFNGTQSFSNYNLDMITAEFNLSIQDKKENIASLKNYIIRDARSNKVAIPTTWLRSDIASFIGGVKNTMMIQRSITESSNDNVLSSLSLDVRSY